jgi:hypothetical protein
VTRLRNFSAHVEVMAELLTRRRFNRRAAQQGTAEACHVFGSTKKTHIISYA